MLWDQRREEASAERLPCKFRAAVEEAPGVPFHLDPLERGERVGGAGKGVDQSEAIRFPIGYVTSDDLVGQPLVQLAIVGDLADQRHRIGDRIVLRLDERVEKIGGPLAKARQS